jgi:hypothetical protein
MRTSSSDCSGTDLTWRRDHEESVSLANIDSEKIKRLLATHIDGEARLLSAIPLTDQISKSVCLIDDRLVTPFRFLSEFDHYCRN